MHPASRDDRELLGLSRKVVEYLESENADGRADTNRRFPNVYAKILAPFLDVSEPIRWSIRVQLAIRRNTVDDDRRVPEHAAEQTVIVGVEAVDVGLD